MPRTGRAAVYEKPNTPFVLKDYAPPTESEMEERNREQPAPA